MSTCLHKVRDYSYQAKGGVTVDMSQTKPGSRLVFLWRGCHFKRVVVTVDLIPAIEIAGWPSSTMRPPELGSERKCVRCKHGTTTAYAHCTSFTLV